MSKNARSKFASGAERSRGREGPATATATATATAISTQLLQLGVGLLFALAWTPTQAAAAVSAPAPRFLPVGPDEPVGPVEDGEHDAGDTPSDASADTTSDTTSDTPSDVSAAASEAPNAPTNEAAPAPEDRYPLDSLDVLEAPAATPPAKPATTPASEAPPGRPPRSDPSKVTVVDMTKPREVPTRPTAPTLTLTPSVEFNLRSQGRYNASFDPEPGDRSLDIFQRSRLGLDAAYGDHVGVFIQAQDVRSWGFERSTIANMANTDLHQGFLYLQGSKGGASGMIKIGRQELIVGSGRLIANRNWVPVAQSFDALRLMGTVGRWSADAGLMLLRGPGAFTIAHPSGDPTLAETVQSSGTLSGYLQLKLDLGPSVAIEALGIGLRERPSPAAPTASRDLVNGGLRVYGEPVRGLSYDLEGYAQGGRNLGLAHRAFAAFATLRYALDVRARPTFTLRYNYASGESCEEGPEVGCGNQQSREFYRFYGARHPFYGLLDRIAHSNLRNLEVGGSIRGWTHYVNSETTFDRLMASLSYNFIQLDKPTGAWKSAPDPLIGAGWDPTNTSRNLGHELDLVLTYKPIEKLTVQPGYGLFIPLEAAQRIAGPATQHLAYLMLVAIF